MKSISQGQSVGKKSVTSPWPIFADDEIEAVVRVLQSGKVNYWTGEEGRLFEEEFAGHVETRHAIALANGTVALELALYALGIGPGDEVITTSRTFIASASAIVMRGATPVLADVDLESQNITAETIAAVLTDRTRAVIVVHLAGRPCEMDSIMALAAKHRIKVVEDCAQAHGALYKGRKVGSMGHVGAFSFCQDKIMTTGGEGGMLTTDDDDLWECAWSYKDHGKSRQAVFDQGHPPGFRWLHESFGTNLRMTEIQAALGRVVLRKLPDWVALRRRNAAILDELFSDLQGLRICVPPPHLTHSYYKYYAFVRPENLKNGWNRDRIMQAIAAEGVPCLSGSCSEIYLEKAFIDRGIGPSSRLPAARELGENSLMFLVHPSLEVEEMHYCGTVARKVIQEAQIT
ncbi:MAG: DegT/DnrJ/EryC1/StrS aminotransferase family protein [Syntrophotaleaceae bacterium]